VPDAGDFDVAIPIIIENVNHCFGTNDINLSCAARDELAVGCEIAWIDLGDFYVFFENFHSGFYRKMIKGIARTIKAMRKPATSWMTGLRLWYSN
jgi:hypothetical protein